MRHLFILLKIEKTEWKVSSFAVSFLCFSAPMASEFSYNFPICAKWCCLVVCSCICSCFLVVERNRNRDSGMSVTLVELKVLNLWRQFAVTI
jgi:hypothetical protein